MLCTCSTAQLEFFSAKFRSIHETVKDNFINKKQLGECLSCKNFVALLHPNISPFAVQVCLPRYDSVRLRDFLHKKFIQSHLCLLTVDINATSALGIRKTTKHSLYKIMLSYDGAYYFTVFEGS